MGAPQVLHLAGVDHQLSISPQCGVTDGGHAVDVRGVEVLRREVGVEDAHETARLVHADQAVVRGARARDAPAELDLAMAPDCGQQSHSREPMGSRRRA